MKVIGIDLGTTTSEVAYYKNGSGEIIKNIREGDSTIVPSVVLIEGRKITVGAKAKNQSVLKSKNTVIEIKRLMGTESLIEIDNKKYSPIEVSSMILKEIKEIAEFYLGENITEAVITVPANFNDKARRATKEAGKLAGLNVERIINEPTAAAIAYGINKMEDNINILVYDFGGGTIDVTVLELFEGVLDIKASRGNNIGGKDIDEVIGKFIVDEFYKKNNIRLDLKSPRILSVIKSVSEECKKNLSFQKEWQVIVPYIAKSESGDTIDLDITVTQADIKELASKIIKSTEAIIDRTLEGAKLRAEDINKVVLVGGSTRMPLVKEMIKGKFGVAKIAMGINPEEVVAIGAAIQAGIKNNASDDKGIVVVDACSHTLGVEVFGNKFDPIILRDSKLPAMVTKRYRTVENNQDEAIINIYEGEHDEVEKNILLDSLSIKDIPLSPKGKEVIDITFEYDLNGILDVEVEVISTGNVDKKNIGNISGNIEGNNRVFEDQHGDVQDIEIERKEYSEVSKLANEVVEEKEVTESNDEIKTEDLEVKDSEGVAEVVEEEEDYSNIYNEVVSVVNYVNANLDQCSDEVQKEVREMYQDLLASVKNEEFKKCRDIENEILAKMGL